MELEWVDARGAILDQSLGSAEGRAAVVELLEARKGERPTAPEVKPPERPTVPQFALTLTRAQAAAALNVSVD